MIKIGRDKVHFQKSFDSFCYQQEKSCKVIFMWITVWWLFQYLILGFCCKFPKIDLIMLANISLLKLCEKSKEKARTSIFWNLIFQVNRYDKEVSLNVAACLLIVLKHQQVSQKPSQKKEMVIHEKTIRKNSSRNYMAKYLKNIFSK